MPPGRLRLAFVLLPFVLAACHKAAPVSAPLRTPAPPAAPARPAPPTPRPVAATRPAAPTPLTEEELFSRKSLDEVNAEHPLTDAFFAYDQSALDPSAQQSLQKDAQWLQRWPRTAIRIDGHCDERGTAEYNLALGNRRAMVVRDYLTSLGVTADRIQVRSLGKEAPFCDQTGEVCWSQNRRGHFVVTAK